MEFGITCWGASKNKKIKNIQNIQKKRLKEQFQIQASMHIQLHFLEN